ncbi:MAG: hypothetical protein HGA76_00655 [Candidatus Firestonebacteria bacterium]|nr:hypothetical protein [Candidatus Firestonebacteria bacterium]
MVIKKGVPSRTVGKWMRYAAFLLLVLGVNSAWAATNFLVMPPVMAGQGYTAGTAPNRYNPVTQVAGEAFNVTMYCYNDGTNNPVNSNGAATTMGSSSTSPLFSPSSPALTQTFSGTANSMYSPVATTLYPASTGTYTILASANGGAGINGDSVTINVQSVNYFEFVIGTFTAGSAGTLTIRARDSANNVCDRYNTTTGVRLYASDAGANGAEVDLGLIQFTNGVYTSSSLTFYHATQYARFRAVKAGAPAVTSNAAFTIGAAASNQLLILGPGQSISSGTSTGNGRSSGSTITTGQTAGTNFSMTVYACDAYWNTKAASTTIQLTSADPAFTPITQAISGSSVVFSTVNLHTAGTFAVTANDTGGGGFSSQSDNVPVSAAALDHFGVSVGSNDVNAAIAASTGNTSVVVVAFDIYGNTRTTVGGTTVLTVLQSGVPLKPGVSTYGVTPNTTTLTGFSNGVFTGSLFVRKIGFNYSVRITNGSVVTNSGVTFGVLAAGPAYKYIVCMPGQTLIPGEVNGTLWGRIGNPNNITAGVPVGVSVLVTDQHGNKVVSSSTVNATLDVSDSAAVFSPTLPFAIPSNNLLTVTLTKAAQSPQQQQLKIIHISDSYLDSNSGYFNVVANSLDHFSIANIGLNQTAGTSFTANITALDIYNNAVMTYANPIYLTSPLLDYHNPEQSVISVAGGTATGVTWTVTGGGFVNGVLASTITVYRAGTANIFVSSIADGTGSTGTSASFTVAPANMTKVFVIVPGIQYRPGTGGGIGNSLGGYSPWSNPDAQQVGTAFGVTVYATDAWWNQVPGINYGFHTYSLPTTSSINSAGWNFTNGMLLLSVNLSAPASYNLTISSDVGGITNYTTVYYITGIAVDHFTISSPDGVAGALPVLMTAGVPINLSIVAYSDSSNVATTFNGQANLTTSADWQEPFRVISPQRVNFVNGKWFGQVTIYRQFPNITIQCNLGTAASNVPNNPTVMHNARKQLLIIAPGMSGPGMSGSLTGTSPDTYPPGGYPGYTGNPVIQEAGKPFLMKFFLCDQYWNVVTTTANTAMGGGLHQIRITSSDPYPGTLEGSTIPLNINLRADLGFSAGAYATNGAGNFKLYTVGSNGYQTVTVHDNSDPSVADFTLGGTGGTNAYGIPPINIMHTTLAIYNTTGDPQAFKIQPVPNPSGHMMAGVPFWCTITAQDQYGNVMDARNGATAFPAATNVTLDLASASNTMYPLTVQLPNAGVGSFFLTAYKFYVGTGNVITAQFIDANTHKGFSSSFNVDSNVFTRLVPIVNGMSQSGGFYSGTVPSVFPGYTGSPAAQTAGTMVNFQVYACDTYGNITTGATDYVGVTSTDQYAPNPRRSRLIWNSGLADFNNTLDPFAFHRAVTGSAVITVTDYANTLTGVANGSILQGVTPAMTVNPASAFGLISLAPGQVLVEGSGNSRIPSGLIGGVFMNGWYAGVTPTVIPKNNTINVYAGGSELSGVYFPVTVQATDVYGNRVSINDAFQLQTSTEGNGLGEPNVSLPLNGTLSGGSKVVNARQITTGGQVIFPWDVTNSGTLNPTGGARTDLNITTLGQTHFILAVNGIYGAGPVYVPAAPRTFTLRVEVRDDYNDLIVGTANVEFILETFTDAAQTQKGSNLSLMGGQTQSGSVDLTESYPVAQTLYIRVSEKNGSSTPIRRTSPEIRVQAGGPASIAMSLDPNFATNSNEMHANEIKTIYAKVVDSNGNPVGGDTLNFAIADNFSSRLWDGAVALTGTASLTGGTGIATTDFKAAGNEEAYVTSVSTQDPTIKGTLKVRISVTQNGGVYPNPFNPASTNPRDWAHIDYRLDQDASVKIYIYTLFGDLVWHKEITGGTEGAKAGMNTTVWNGKNDNNVTVANGGYIISVKVNDQQKYRFKIGAYKQK